MAKTTLELKRLQSSPAAFREALKISAGSKIVRLSAIMDDWQRRDFEALDPGWMMIAGKRPEAGVDGRIYFDAYLERPRGHSKTSDIAAMVSWALFASQRPIYGMVAAASRDQARLLRNAIRQLVAMNRWLSGYVLPQKNSIVNPHTGSEAIILSSDAEVTFGHTPSFVVCDELTHWSGSSGSAQWESIISSQPKRGDQACMFVIISNAGAGMGKSWQWRIREDYRTDKDSYFVRLDGPRASWITAKSLEKQKQRLSHKSYCRLWLNQWQQAAGDALDPEDIDACCVLRSPGDVSADMIILGGLDLGIKHDHAGFVTLGAVPGTDRVRLIECESWKPLPGGEVDLDSVERAVARAFEKYGHSWIGYDPNQAVHMAQRLRRQELPMEEVPFVGKNLDLMARELLQAFRARKIEMYRDQELLDDLRKLSIVERRYGYKLEAIADETGHADRATGLAIALPAALDVASAAAEEEEEEDSFYRVVA